MPFKRKSKGSNFNDPLPEGRVLRGRIFVSLELLSALAETDWGRDWRPDIVCAMSDDQALALDLAGLAYEDWIGFYGTDKLRSWMKSKKLM